MGDSPSSNQTVRNITEVDPTTQAWRGNIMNAGNALWNQGVPQFYPGNTVVPFSNQTQSGLDYLQGFAGMGPTNLEAAYDASGRALSGNNPAMGFAQNAAGGGLNNQQTGALQGFTSGQVNPGLRSLFDQGANDIRNAVGTQFAQAGRFGSGAAHADTLSRNIGNLWGQIYAPAFENAQNRGLQASQAMAGFGADDANRQLQGADLYGSMFAQGNADAARAQALLPSLYSYGMMPGQSMLDVGGIYEDQAGQYLGADQERYNYNATAPWDFLSQYAGMMSGLPDFSGSTQQSTGQQGTNRVMQGLGAAASLASIFSAFSDRRLKRDVEHVGEHKGIPWYRFRYVWDRPGMTRYGVMADEAPAHAVHEHPSGFLMVDYGAI